MRGAPVTLTWQEFAAATHTGLLRFAQSESAGMNHASTYHRNDWTERLRDEVTGACGEIAVAKLLGWYWSPSVNTFHHVADVGSEYKVEVRATLRTDGHLIVRDNDAPERFYAFVVGAPPERDRRRLDHRPGRHVRRVATRPRRAQTRVVRAAVRAQSFPAAEVTRTAGVRACQLQDGKEVRLCCLSP